MCTKGVQTLKKYIILIIVISTILSFAGCNRTNEIVTTTTDSPPVLTTPKAIIPEGPDIDYHFDSVTDVRSDDIGIRSNNVDYEIKDEKDNTVMLVSMTLPVVEYVSKGDKEEAVAKVISDVEKIFNNDISIRSEKYLADSKAKYKFTCIPSYLVSYRITDFSADYVSLLYTIHETNAEGILTLDSVCIVIDLKGGFAIDLSTLIMSVKYSSFVEDVKKKISAKDVTFFNNYETKIQTLIPKCWLLYNNGVMILIPPYQITPGYYGYLDVMFSNSELSDYLSDYGKVILGGSK